MDPCVHPPFVLGCVAIGPDRTRGTRRTRLDTVRATYAEMSEIYQANKGDARNIPLK